MGEKYLSVNEYLRANYGRKVYKLALNGGKTCPNRDGKCGSGGCIFCGGGSGNFASDTIDDAIGRLSNKNTGDKYIAYFQSFTSTYKMDDNIKQRMLDAAGDERIAIISIASRPDCMDGDVIDFLRKLAKIKPLWVELGLQTIHEKTAEYINRGYELKVFEQAVGLLRDIGAEVIVHLIIGLPGESREDMLESVRYLNSMDVQGVKLQLLHVLEGTKLGDMFNQGQVRWNIGAEPCGEETTSYPLSLEQYTEIIIDCIGNLRPDMVIHRITGDAPKSILIEPKWSGDKKRVLNTMRKRINETPVYQGSLLTDYIQKDI